MITLYFLLVWLCVCLTSSALITLSTTSLSVTIDDANGLPTALTHLQSSQNLLSTASLTRIFQLKIDSVMTNPGAFSSCSEVSDAFAHNVTCSWSSCGAIGQVDTQWWVYQDTNANDDDIHTEISFAVPGGVTVTEVEFPQLYLERITPATDERLFLPFGDGVVLRTIAIDDMWNAATNPGHVSIQVVSYYGPSHGLGIEIHDETYMKKSIGVETTSDPGGAVRFILNTKHPKVVGSQVASVEFVLFATSGTWVETANHYRRWAQTTHWYREGLAKDTPSWVADDRIVLFESGLAPQYCGLQFVPISLLCEIADEWSASLSEGIPGDRVRMMPILTGWERYGQVISPWYRPLTTGWPNVPDEEGLGDAIGDLTNDRGHHAWAMVDGVQYVISRGEYRSGEAWWVTGFDGMVEDPVGSGDWKNGYDELSPKAIEICTLKEDQSDCEIWTPYAEWVATRTEMCVAEKPDHSENYATQVLVELAELFAGMGLDLFEMDLINGGGTAPCWNASHAHPPGYGTWSGHGVLDLFHAIRDAGRAINEDFTVSVEDPQEILLPVVDLFGCRPALINTWPGPEVSDRLTPDGVIEEFSVTVPAFSTVYGKLGRCMAFNVNLHSNWIDHDPSMTWLNDLGLETQNLMYARTFIAGSLTSIFVEPWMLVAEYAPSPPGWTTDDDQYARNYPKDTIKMTPDRAHAIQYEFIRRMVRVQFNVLKPYWSDPEVVSAEVGDPGPALFAWQQSTTKHRDTLPLLRAWRLKSDPSRVALAIVNWNYLDTLEVGVPVSFDGVAIDPQTCFHLWTDGCVRKKAKLADWGASVVIQKSGTVVWEMVPDDGECDSEATLDLCGFGEDEWVVYAIVGGAVGGTVVIVCVVVSLIVAVLLYLFVCRRRPVKVTHVTQDVDTVAAPIQERDEELKAQGSGSSSSSSSDD